MALQLPTYTDPLLGCIALTQEITSNQGKKLLTELFIFVCETVLISVNCLFQIMDVNRYFNHFPDS